MCGAVRLPVMDNYSFLAVTSGLVIGMAVSVVEVFFSCLLAHRRICGWVRSLCLRPR